MFCYAQLLNFQFVRNPIVVGEYDAIVSYVDPGATGFFLRNGFSSDLILNNRFRCTLYLDSLPGSIKFCQA